MSTEEIRVDRPLREGNLQLRSTTEKQTAAAPRLSRRQLLTAGAACVGAAIARPLMAAAPPVRVFDVGAYGAVGDGGTLDTAAIQRAIDAAAAYSGKAQVLVRGGKRYLIGTLLLKSRIDFHLADDAELLLSTRREDYAEDAAITAHGAEGLTISGTGTLQGRAREFMAAYDQQNQIWRPKGWRPKMFVLTGCKDLAVREIGFAEAPNWGLHLLGCEGVLVDGVRIRNLLTVPNCDGIDPDHSRNVEIRNCHIACGDDAIVVKTSSQAIDYGPAANISVRDCVIQTQDAGLKIGTETTSDIHDIRFESCQIRSSSRGLCIQLRDEGDVYNIAFRNISLVSEYFPPPWWGRDESISFTAIPRRPGAKVGKLHGLRVQNVTGRAENSARIRGSDESHVRDVVLDRVHLTLDRWTSYPGGVYDNRPTTAIPGIEPHATAGFSIEDADDITLRECRVTWGANRPEYFSYAVEAKDVTGLKLEGFHGAPARPSLGKAVSIS